MTQNLTYFLTQYLPKQRWFQGKNLPIESLEIEDILETKFSDLLWLIVKIKQKANISRYNVPILLNDSADNGILSLTSEILSQPQTSKDIISDFPYLFSDFTIELLSGEQSNTSIKVVPKNHPLILIKFYRKLLGAASPEISVLKHLSKIGFKNSPKYFGSFKYKDDYLCLIQSFEGGKTRLGSEISFSVNSQDYNKTLNKLKKVGKTIGLLHKALSCDKIGEFSAESVNLKDLKEIEKSFLNQLNTTFSALKDAPLGKSLNPYKEHLIKRQEDLKAFINKSLFGHKIKLPLAKIHGDMNFDQILENNNGKLIILDFEGAPMKSESERRKKSFQLADIAMLIRALSYIKEIQLKTHKNLSQTAAKKWEEACKLAILEGYKKECIVDLELLNLFILDKALYEINYELCYRPDWLEIPLKSTTELIEEILSKN